MERLTRERDHWKANHDEMVARNAVLRDRPDLPVERLPALARIEARAETAEAALAEARERLEKRGEALQTIAGGHVGTQWSTGQEVIGMLQQIARAALTGDAQEARR